jgi:hypothetical protein
MGVGLGGSREVQPLNHGHRQRPSSGWDRIEVTIWSEYTAPSLPMVHQKTSRPLGISPRAERVS